MCHVSFIARDVVLDHDLRIVKIFLELVDIKFYCLLCGCHFDSAEVVVCPVCGGDRVVAGGKGFYE